MSRRSLALALVAATLSSAQAGALDDRLRTSLLKLEPETRFHQICDIEMMRRIQASGALQPDRLVMDATIPAETTGDTIVGRGGAVRSGGVWYRLRFVCSATHDRLEVTRLTYRLGNPIPARDLETYGLWR